MVDINTPEFPLTEALKLPVMQWKNKIENAFEKSVFKLHPEISALKQSLYQSGAVYAAMSGSGSSVFGIFKEKKEWNAQLGRAHIWTELI
jgi:4-diphosphocytidyl-2-C-methyl-D-erythritol kinase